MQEQQGQQSLGSPRSVAALLSDGEDPELAAAIAASFSPQAGACEPEQQQQGEQPQAPARQQGGEEQAAAALAAQLPELPAEPEAGGEGVVEVAVRLPGGCRASRRFSAVHTVGHLAAFAASQGADMAACQLALQFPRRVLSDWGQSLGAAAVGDKQLVALEPK